jgi:hypothetical protein
LTFAELDALLHAAARREERERKFQAQMTANVMNCWLKRAVTVEMLLGLPPLEGRKSFQAMSLKEKAQALDGAWAMELKRRGERCRRLHKG